MLFSQSVRQFYGSYLPPPYSFDSSFYRWDRGVFLQGPQIKRFSRSKSRALWAQYFLLVSMRESICSPPTVPAVDTKTQATPRKDWRQHPRIDAHRGKKKTTQKHGFSVAQMLTGFCTCTFSLFSFCFIFWSYLRIIL